MNLLRRLAAAAVTAGALMASLQTTQAADAAGAAPLQQPGQRAARASAVGISVDSVSPSAPAASKTPRPLRVQLTLTNETGAALNEVRVLGFRGAPLVRQSTLDAAIADTTPTATGEPFPSTPAVSVDLAAGASTTVTFVTATDILDDEKSICFCADGVYPLYFTADVTGSDGVSTVLGTTTTYLPSFLTRPVKTRVSWIWPLIDQPHRLTSDTVFTDDSLASSVGSGRLDAALTVVEGVENAADIPITLVIDPELLDELEVMSTGKYTVKTGTAAAVAGTGQVDAVTWLARLKALLQDHPDVTVELTPYADPDIQSLSASGLSWATTLPTTMATRVSEALAGRAEVSDVALPAAGVLGTQALTALAGSGTSTVVLDAAGLRSHTDSSGVPLSFAKVQTSSGELTAAVSPTPISAGIDAAVQTGGAAALPALTAQIAVQVAQEPGTAHSVVMVAPRYVDPSPQDAERAILDTSTSPFTSPSSLQDAAAAATTTPTVRAAPIRSGSAGLPDQVIADLSDVSMQLPAVDALLHDSAPAASLLQALPLAVQRVSSSAWRTDEADAAGDLGVSRGAALSAQVDTIMSGVEIVRPSSGSYTLASSNSPLPITVRNNLDYSVTVDVQVTTRNGLPGFTASPVISQTIGPRRLQPLHIPTRVERSGRIQVQAQLSSPDGTDLGGPVFLTVHSTVLGTIGVVITVAAGAVLLLALLVRLTRRLTRRRKGTSTRSEKRALAVAGPAGRDTSA